jgi:hypothetical protein
LGLAHPREEEQWRKIEKRQGNRNNAETMRQPLRKSGQPEIEQDTEQLSEYENTQQG